VSRWSVVKSSTLLKLTLFNTAIAFSRLYLDRLPTISGVDKDNTAVRMADG